MVRFGWHVEDGLGAHILPGKMSVNESNGISHATCSIEVRHDTCRRESPHMSSRRPNETCIAAQVAEDKQPLQAIFTLPQHFLQRDHVRSRHLIYCMCCCTRRLQPPHVAGNVNCLCHL